jgi:cellobiose phosphorylase
MAHLLSNGRYHVLVDASGGGWSHHDDLAVTRWNGDPVCRSSGSFCYLRDLADGRVWSTTVQPMRVAARIDEVHADDAAVVFVRRVHGIGTEARIVVVPGHDVEIRRVMVTNHDSAPRRIELTSFAEVVLAPAAADSAHPAFSKLFVASEWLAEKASLLCRRRARAEGDPAPWMFHRLLADGATPASFETDRARFIGRARTLANPLALALAGPLSNTVGPVLDPVVAIRTVVALEPGASACLDFLTGAAGTREDCLALIAALPDRGAVDEALAAAPAQSRAQLAALGIDPGHLESCARLAAALAYVDPALRGSAAAIAANRRGQPSLWRYSISGDLPIVLATLPPATGDGFIDALAQAHAYCSHRGLASDLVLECADAATCKRVLERLRALGGDERIDKPGGFFVRERSAIEAADRTLLQAIAHVALDAGDGTLAELLARGTRAPAAAAAAMAPTAPPAAPAAGSGPPDWPGDLDCFNGIGGFAADGCEYVMRIDADTLAPAPWVNVLANPGFGSLVSECGSTCTWRGNSHEFRLTPWSNDPVCDTPGEALYIRDQHGGDIWSPTPLPCGLAAPTTVRHGFGYSVFEHREHGIASTLTLFVAPAAPIRYALLALRNDSATTRALSVTAYVEWLLGDERRKHAMHVVTRRDEASGAMLAENAWNTDFSGRVAFLDCDAAVRAMSGDRAAFLGDGGSVAAPAALSRPDAGGALGAGLDPCGVLQVDCSLAPGETREMVFRLGAAGDEAELRHLLDAPRDAAAAHAALAQTRAHWRDTLTRVQVRTPERAFDLMANGWLVYQVLSCRLWGRTAFYQSSGAYGFRDQLQDVLALLHAAPGEVRAHLLRSAARQFPEGDVQHWWHPPSGRGVRTRCSDDCLWLPYVLCRYVASSGDEAVLDEEAGFIGGRALADGEDSNYAEPQPCSERADLYQHARRALEHGLRFGAHGLPLMGTGDWNDGMNRVGDGGKGESVWLAFFLRVVLLGFAPLARRRGDAEFAGRCEAEAARLDHAVAVHAWDGQWYQRAWFDDGSPLGVARNAECRIDSIAQSWSVFARGGDRDRQRRAMQSVHEKLVHADSALVQLLDPPFDHSRPTPGYIQGYLPGVRENGAQYTHAAVWAAMAFAALDDPGHAWELARLLNPVLHADDAGRIAVWRTEPYVMASDVYALPPHTGRGGWTWYTGSAGWMYQLLVESLLGLHRDGDRLRVEPCLPPHWDGFEIDYRHGASQWHIVIARGAPGDSARVEVDGTLVDDGAIALEDDGRHHDVQLRLPAQNQPRIPA